MATVTSEQALAMIAAATEEAGRIGRAMSFAVVDAGGHPVAMVRMDGASLLGAQTVLAKARTAVYCQRPTHVSLERAQAFPHVYHSLSAAADQPLVFSMGGFPLYRDGALAGAFAASGGTGDEDITLSSQALKRWEQASG